MYLGGIMRTTITLIVGLSTVFLFLSIYGTPYVNGQSSTLNETSSTNSVPQTENSDPFVLKGSSNAANTDNSNDPAQADDGSSANSNNDDTSIANDESSANSNNDGDESSANSNNDGDESSANSNNDDSEKDGSDDDKSSKDDKESKDDKKFELPFP